MTIHVMNMINKLDNGSEVYYCPVCHRKLLIVWLPKFSKTVIDKGDDTVSHKSMVEVSE